MDFHREIIADAYQEKRLQMKDNYDKAVINSLYEVFQENEAIINMDNKYVPMIAKCINEVSKCDTKATIAEGDKISIPREALIFEKERSMKKLDSVSEEVDKDHFWISPYCLLGICF